MNRCQTVLPLRSLTMTGDKQEVVIRVEEVVTSTFLIEVVKDYFEEKKWFYYLPTSKIKKC